MPILPRENLQHRGVGKCESGCVVASSFESGMVLLHVASPIHARPVASKCNLQRQVAGYESSARGQMERRVQQPIRSANKDLGSWKTEQDLSLQKTTKIGSTKNIQKRTYGTSAGCITAKHQLIASSGKPKTCVRPGQTRGRNSVFETAKPKQNHSANGT